MDANQVRKTIVQVAHILGLALTVVAVAKFFGASIPLQGSVGDTALLACACLLAK